MSYANLQKDHMLSFWGDEIFGASCSGAKNPISSLIPIVPSESVNKWPSCRSEFPYTVDAWSLRKCSPTTRVRKMIETDICKTFLPSIASLLPFFLEC